MEKETERTREQRARRREEVSFTFISYRELPLLLVCCYVYLFFFTGCVCNVFDEMPDRVLAILTGFVPLVMDLFRVDQL